MKALVFEIVAGVRANGIDEVSEGLKAFLGSECDKHDSLYLGEYNQFHCPEALVVKYNLVESEGEWDEPEFQHLSVLISVNETERPQFFLDLIRRLEFRAEIIRYCQ